MGSLVGAWLEESDDDSCIKYFFRVFLSEG